ncbi:unnamed protein product, partial [Mesorhabditis spiculigera]
MDASSLLKWSRTNHRMNDFVNHYRSEFNKIPIDLSIVCNKDQSTKSRLNFQTWVRAKNDKLTSWEHEQTVFQPNFMQISIKKTLGGRSGFKYVMAFELNENGTPSALEAHPISTWPKYKLFLQKTPPLIVRDFFDALGFYLPNIIKYCTLSNLSLQYCSPELVSQVTSVLGESRCMVDCFKYQSSGITPKRGTPGYLTIKNLFCRLRALPSLRSFMSLPTFGIDNGQTNQPISGDSLLAVKSSAYTMELRVEITDEVLKDLIMEFLQYQRNFDEKEGWKVPRASTRLSALPIIPDHPTFVVRLCKCKCGTGWMYQIQRGGDQADLMRIFWDEDMLLINGPLLQLH